MSLVLRILQLCSCRSSVAEVGQRLPIPLALPLPTEMLECALMVSRTGRIIKILTSAGFLWKPWWLAFHMR